MKRQLKFCSKQRIAEGQRSGRKRILIPCFQLWQNSATWVWSKTLLRFCQMHTTSC